MKWLRSTRARRARPAPRPRVAARADALEQRTLLSGSFSVRDAEVIEGDSGFPQLAFTITWADSIAVENGWVNVSTSNGTATAPADYAARNQRVDFLPFESRTQSFLVSVRSDNVDESDETVFLTLSAPFNATIADGSAVGTIREDDDRPPTVTITPISPDPRESPVTSATFTFSEPVTGVDLSDLTLFVNEGPNLLTGAQSVATSDGGTTWVLSGLSSVTVAVGQYVLAVAGRGPTGIVDAAGNPLSEFAVMEVWRKIPLPAPTNLRVYHFGTFNRGVFTDNATSETSYFGEKRWFINAFVPLENFPPSAAGQTGTVMFDDYAIDPTVQDYRYVVAAYYQDGAQVIQSAQSNFATPVAAGLRQTLFDTTDLRDNPANPDDSIVRIDPEINHNFDAEGAGSPAPGKIDADTFSIIWEGHFTPSQGGDYTFFGGSDDGIRVYLNGNPIVDAFVDRVYTETPSAPITLNAGQKYELRIEYYDSYGGAAVALKYEGPGVTGRQVVPFTHLSPPIGNEPPRTPTDVVATKAADCVTVWFHDVSMAETGYRIERSTTPGGGFVPVGTAPANADHFMDPGPLLTDGTAYYYRVRAAGANGAFSAYSPVTGPVVPTAPGGAVNYPTFADNGAERALTLNGSAALVDRNLDRRTRERLMLTDAINTQAGSAYLTEARNVMGFSAAFDFQVTQSNGADGFTFFLQSARAGTAALGAAGGGLGFAGIRKSVAVKFDFFPGRTNQTGLYTNGDDISDAESDIRNRNIPGAFDLDNGQIYRATLSYDPGAKVLTQTIDDLGSPETLPFSTTYAIDIPAAIGRCAYVGFTGGTGNLNARQEVLSLSFGNWVPPPEAPRVQQVYVRGTAWTASFMAYLAAQGIGSSQFGYAIGEGTSQLADLPWRNVNEVSVSFTGDVMADSSDLAVRGVSVAGYGVSAFVYDPTTHTGTWTLAQNIANDKVLLDLDGDAPNGVRGAGAGGLLLDGEWTTGGTYPGGNGTPGGDFRFRFDALPGNVNRAGNVLADDFSAVKARFFRSTVSPGTGANTYTIFHDVDGSGSILADDFSAVKARFFMSLPGPEPTEDLFGNMNVV